MAELDITPDLTETPAPGAPPVIGSDPPASPPASVDPTVSPEAAPPSPPKAEPDRKTAAALARLRRENRELLRENGRQQGLSEARAATPPADKPGPPKQSDFNNFDDYIAAVVSHAGQEAAEKATEKVTKQLEGKRSQDTTQETGNAFWKTVAKEAKDKGIATFAEAMESIRTGEVTTSPAMSHYVIEDADNKAALVAWLAENPDEAERIAGLDPVRAGAAMAKVDARLGTKPAPVSKAPAPVPQPSGGGSVPISIERMSHDDLSRLVGKWNRDA